MKPPSPHLRETRDGPPRGNDYELLTKRHGAPSVQLEPVTSDEKWRGSESEQVVPTPARTPRARRLLRAEMFTFCKLHKVFCRCLGATVGNMAAALRTAHRCGTMIALAPGHSCPA